MSLFSDKTFSVPPELIRIVSDLATKNASEVGGGLLTCGKRFTCDFCDGRLKFSSPINWKWGPLTVSATDIVVRTVEGKKQLFVDIPGPVNVVFE